MFRLCLVQGLQDYCLPDPFLFLAVSLIQGTQVFSCSFEIEVQGTQDVHSLLETREVPAADPASRILGFYAYFTKNILV